MTAKLFFSVLFSNNDRQNLFEESEGRNSFSHFIVAIFHIQWQVKHIKKDKYSGAHLVSHECVGEATVESRNIIK